MKPFFKILSRTRYNGMRARIRDLAPRQGLRDLMLLHKSEIRAVMENMGDEKSRVAYKNELAAMLLDREIAEALGILMSFEDYNRMLAAINPADYPDLEYPDSNVPPEYTGHAFACPQYEYEDRVCLNPGGVLLDCGSCAGDIAVWAQRKAGKTGRVYAFEPHPQTFEMLQRTLARYAPDVQAFNCAIGDKKGTVPFSDEGTPSSRVDPASSLTVPMHSLDDFCEEHGVKPNLIKMDIEGYEPEGLQGAARTIEKHRPDLAICVYHKPSHMWEIGTAIRALCPEYTFYFKKHHPIWESVLYATIRR